MKDLILNVLPEEAERFYRGETYFLPCSQIPDLAHKQHPRVYICVNKQITGVGFYVDAHVRKEEFINSKKDHYGHYIAWEVMADRQFMPPRQLSEFWTQARSGRMAVDQAEIADIEMGWEY